MLRILCLVLVVAILGCDATTEPKIGPVPSGPDASPVEFQAFLGWIAANPPAAMPGDDDMPDKVCGISGAAYCREVYEGLSWCTTACGEHHWMTASACYDLQGRQIACN